MIIRKRKSKSKSKSTSTVPVKKKRRGRPSGKSKVGVTSMWVRRFGVASAKPAASTDKINPGHYKENTFNHPKHGTLVLEPVFVMEAFADDNADLAQALKYILRKGSKTDNSYTDDLTKGIWWLVRLLSRNNVARDVLEAILDRHYSTAGLVK